MLPYARVCVRRGPSEVHEASRGLSAELIHWSLGEASQFLLT